MGGERHAYMIFYALYFTPRINFLPGGDNFLVKETKTPPGWRKNVKNNNTGKNWKNTIE